MGRKNYIKKQQNKIGPPPPPPSVKLFKKLEIRTKKTTLSEFFFEAMELFSAWTPLTTNPPPPWRKILDPRHILPHLLKLSAAYKHTDKSWESSGSVVECLARDPRSASSSLTGITVLWSLSKTHLS